MVTELQSGAASCVWTEGLTAVSADQLAAFAALVAEAEREACAKACEDEAVDASVSPEDAAYNTALEHAADAIRMRSNDQVVRPAACGRSEPTPG